MSKDFDLMEDSNRSANPSIHELSGPDRRAFVLGGLGALAWSVLAPRLAGLAAAGDLEPLIGFRPVPVSDSDAVIVPEGYEAVAFAAWGEPVGVPGNMPAFRWDAGNSAADQSVQMGMHHDGIHYFPLDGSSTHGLLVMNHEYTDDGLLFPDGKKHWTSEKVAKAQAAHGVAVIEVALRDGR
ncbi:MAG TPA: alkaline phosphatase PhoX, partial [Chondromyces sp.]|nr:alkaline phosphatase PhoX [Chondromyces sp.]